MKRTDDEVYDAWFERECIEPADCFRQGYALGHSDASTTADRLADILRKVLNNEMPSEQAREALKKWSDETLFSAEIHEKINPANMAGEFAHSEPDVPTAGG